MEGGDGGDGEADDQDTRVMTPNIASRRTMPGSGRSGHAGGPSRGAGGMPVPSSRTGKLLGNTLGLPSTTGGSGPTTRELGLSSSIGGGSGVSSLQKNLLKKNVGGH